MPAPEHSTIAPAKINLTLRVLGRRPDGYHEIESLVAFADFGDRIILQPRLAERSATRSTPADQLRPATLQVRGPFANAIVGDNLVETAIRCVEAAAGKSIGADLILEKHLPVASGMGGGSADAAAALRLLRDTFKGTAGGIDWEGIARGLGADVPVCLAGRSAIMSGTGERITSIDLPKLDIVLANDCQPVPADKTRRVFAALAAPPVGSRPSQALPRVFDLERLLAVMRETGNELERPASAVLPSLSVVKSAVAATAGCEIAVLSGAGPTIVGIHVSQDAAMRAAEVLRARHPRWWVRSGSLGGA